MTTGRRYKSISIRAECENQSYKTINAKAKDDVYTLILQLIHAMNWSLDVKPPVTWGLEIPAAF